MPFSQNRQTVQPVGKNRWFHVCRLSGACVLIFVFGVVELAGCEFALVYLIPANCDIRQHYRNKQRNRGHNREGELARTTVGYG